MTKPSPQIQRDWAARERRGAIAFLRGVCKDWGDNDWPDDLHLVDILDKHLFDYFYHDWGDRKDLDATLSEERKALVDELINIRAKLDAQIASGRGDEFICDIFTELDDVISTIEGKEYEK